MEAAIQRLYAAFGTSPRPTWKQLNGGPFCISEHELEVLTQKPLREMNSRDLGPIWSSCPFTIGDVAAFRYFLPRLFELETLGEGVCGLAGCFSANRSLEHGKLHPEPWTAEQRATLVGALQAYWHTLPHGLTNPPYSPYEEVLESLALLGEPLTPRLREWTQPTTAFAAAGLAQFVSVLLEHWQAESTGLTHLDGNHQEGHSAEWIQARRELLDWLQSPELLEALEHLPPLLPAHTALHPWLTPALYGEMQAEAVRALELVPS